MNQLIINACKELLNSPKLGKPLFFTCNEIGFSVPDYPAHVIDTKIDTLASKFCEEKGWQHSCTFITAQIDKEYGEYWRSHTEFVDPAFPRADTFRKYRIEWLNFIIKELSDENTNH